MTAIRMKSLSSAINAFNKRVDVWKSNVESERGAKRAAIYALAEVAKVVAANAESPRETWNKLGELVAPVSEDKTVRSEWRRAALAIANGHEWAEGTKLEEFAKLGNAYKPDAKGGTGTREKADTPASRAKTARSLANAVAKVHADAVGKGSKRLSDALAKALKIAEEEATAAEAEVEAAKAVKA